LVRSRRARDPLIGSPAAFHPELEGWVLLVVVLWPKPRVRQCGHDGEDRNSIGETPASRRNVFLKCLASRYPTRTPISNTLMLDRFSSSFAHSMRRIVTYLCGLTPTEFLKGAQSRKGSSMPFQRDQRDEFADLNDLRCSRRPALIASGSHIQFSSLYQRSERFRNEGSTSPQQITRWRKERSATTG
jgi:hypothetical protein